MKEQHISNIISVDPMPSWSLASGGTTSTTPPAEEVTLGAVDYSLWGNIGSTVLMKNDITNW